MPPPPENDALRRFLRQVWQEDVVPKLRDHRAAQRAKTARAGGKAAAAAGLLVDTLFRLKGKPFTRALTVMGSSLGAMLPDVWDWKWLRDNADEREREVVREQVRRRAAQLPEADALALFGLSPEADRREFRKAWRAVLLRCHPDKAPDEASQAEYHVRFLAFKAAHERLARAYDEGRLPAPRSA